MSIRQIFEIPGMEEDKYGNYSYSEEYKNQLFKFNDKYIYVKEKNYEEYPSELIDIILEIINQDQKNYVTKQQLEDIDHKIDMLNTELKQSINLKTEQLQSPQKIKEIVSKELTTVYENYEKVIKKLITEKAEQLAIEIDEKSKKLDPMNVAMFKKLGMSMPEIIQLANAGLL